MRVAAALVFGCIGASKFSADSGWIRIFGRIGLGQWFRFLTGALQIVGAVLVLIRWTFAWGILVLAGTMVGAMATRVLLRGAPLNAVVPGAILAALLFVGGDDLMELVSHIGNRFQSLLRSIWRSWRKPIAAH